MSCTPPGVAYLGRTEWMVDGARVSWHQAYKILTHKHHMRHSDANLALVEAVRLDRTPWKNAPSPAVPGLGESFDV